MEFFAHKWVGGEECYPLCGFNLDFSIVHLLSLSTCIKILETSPRDLNFHSILTTDKILKCDYVQINATFSAVLSVLLFVLLCFAKLFLLLGFSLE